VISQNATKSIDSERKEFEKSTNSYHITDQQFFARKDFYTEIFFLFTSCQSQGDIRAGCIHLQLFITVDIVNAIQVQGSLSGGK